MKSKWIIVSNRLPFYKDQVSGEIVRSGGGLASAISAIYNRQTKIWLGTSENLSSQEIDKISDQKGFSYHKVKIEPNIYDSYYNGISNNVLWPLFHYETSLVQFTWEDWENYGEANKIFADSILDIANDNDMVWIHDFHLMLLPEMLKERKSSLKVGFFLHIPFPSSELFRYLPTREKILKSIIKSDLIGFQCYSYLRHFSSSVRDILGLEGNSLLKLNNKGHISNLGVFPAGIDVEFFKNKSQTNKVKKLIQKYKNKRDTEFLLLGVDRLDYIKGIDLKLLALKQLFLEYPDLIGKITLIQIAVPTRTGSEEYIRLKHDIDRLVGQINGEYSSFAYVPINYIYSSVSLSELIALYKSADILWISSKRDGMNLVTQEAIVSQNPSNPGSLLLSEFAGVSSILSHGVIINPWNTHKTAEQIYNTLYLSKEERIHKHSRMLKFLEKYTATDWANNYMEELSTVDTTKQIATPIINKPKKSEDIEPHSLISKIRLPIVLFMDYDGTLVAIKNKPEEAVISDTSYMMVQELSKIEGVSIVIVSGRDSKFLFKQFKGIDVHLAAEHGGKYLPPMNKKWINLVHSKKSSWYPTALKIMNDYSFRVSGSFVEQKKFSIAWHYRNSAINFGKYQASRLKEELLQGFSNLPVSIIEGNKVVEIRSTEANKGSFVNWFLEECINYEIKDILAIGDDTTDEDMFQNLHDNSITIKVGNYQNTKAQYSLENQSEVQILLNQLKQHLQNLVNETHI